MADLHLVTGGAGFIGSNLVRALLERGARVRVLDNYETGYRENLDEVREDVEIFEGDVRDQGACQAACRGVDVVFHQAAVPSVPQSVEDPETSFDVNLAGVHHVLLAARDTGVRRVVLASSAAVYGSSEELPKVETMPLAPVSPYAAAKATGELLLRTFSEAYGLETLSLRYFNVFGPRQDPSNAYAGVIAAFAARMLRGRPPVIFGDGTQSRDFVFIENVVRANLLAAETPNATGEAVNIGCGEAIDLKRMVEDFNAVLGTNFEPEYGPPRFGDVKHSRADVDRARSLLLYEPAVRFREGLAQTLDWYRWALETGYGGWGER